MDFANIKPYEGDQRKGFEELLCQLARRERPENGVAFRRIEGAGGDGGVEALWLLSDGTKIGYQAKYHLRAGDIDWGKIDKSVSQACETYPELSLYVVGIPCDLTGRSGAMGRGKTGWEHWDTHKAKWEEGARSAGLHIVFEPWTKSELFDRLSTIDNAGLRHYWFNVPVFTDQWFGKRFAETKADLGARYSPDDHVPVAANEVLQGLARLPSFKFRILESISKAAPIAYLNESNGPVTSCPPELSNELKSALDSLQEIRSLENTPIFERLLVADWRSRLDRASIAAKHVLHWLGEAKNSSSGEDKELARAWNRISGLLSSLDDLEKTLCGDEVLAESSRVVYFVGEAGVGKTHLFADFAASTLLDQGPSVLMLGQYFDGASIDTNLVRLMDSSKEQFDCAAGALNVAAEAARRRCVILIDAINESQDISKWLGQLGGIIKRILRHDHLAIAFSFRIEYEDYFQISQLCPSAVRVHCGGFLSAEEQENAAHQYIEKRGLVRPVVPWLGEFSNPLFLRTCCNALRDQGKTEFPVGLNGAKQILLYYLDAVAHRLHKSYPKQLEEGCVVRLVKGLAVLMAEQEVDGLSKQSIGEKLEEYFGGRCASDGRIWIETLDEEGLIRKEHDLDLVSDPFDPPERIYKFTYQRFSDHLIADALLSEVSDLKGVFSQGGRLSFIFPKGLLNWKWRGVLGALSIQVPERFAGQELIDYVPGSTTTSTARGPAEDAFFESILWRSCEAFTDRTRTIFGDSKLGLTEEKIEILLRLSVRKAHPWNGEYLHGWLRSLEMPQRDAVWSRTLAFVDLEDRHPLVSLSHWIRSADLCRVDDEVLRLSAVVLTWSFTTTFREMRDVNTKALSTLICSRPTVLPGLLAQFADIDDLYVQERLYAAAYGAVCQGTCDETLPTIASSVYEITFKGNSPPLHFLLRDYALGVLEYAKQKGRLTKDVVWADCTPPYKSDWPLDAVTSEDAEKAAEQAGDDAIYRSACDSLGDFACYEIEVHLDEFSSIPLSQARPLNLEEKFEQFLVISSNWKQESRQILESLIASIDLRRSWLLEQVNSKFSDDDTQGQSTPPKSLAAPEELEEELLDSLDASDQAVYFDLAKDHINPDRENLVESDMPSIDLTWARNWVTKRAYDFGWTRALIPHEISTDLGHERPRTERIGKKYQWLALSELMARLSDNVWLKRGHPEKAVEYSSISQTDSVRDVEATVLIDFESVEGDSFDTLRFNEFSAAFEGDSQDELIRWVSSESDEFNSLDLIERSDSNGEKWLTLHTVVHATERHLNPDTPYKIRRDTWSRVSAVVVPRRKSAAARRKLQKMTLTDPKKWEPVQFVNGQYYMEYPWHPNWHASVKEIENEKYEFCDDIDLRMPVYSFDWESNKDLSLPTGIRCCIPSLWLAEGMGLFPHPSGLGRFVDGGGKLVFVDPSTKQNSASTALIRKEDFLKFLRSEDLDCIWIVAGWKHASPRGGRREWARRTHNGLYWWNGRKWCEKKWFEEESNGLNVTDTHQR